MAAAYRGHNVVVLVILYYIHISYKTGKKVIRVESFADGGIVEIYRYIFPSYINHATRLKHDKRFNDVYVGIPDIVSGPMIGGEVVSICR